MYKNIFDNHLASNKQFSAYMFWGQSDFLIENYALQVALSFAQAEDIQKVYFDEYNFDSCKDYLSQSSLFTPTNVLLIKTNKKIIKKEIDTLIEICNINKDSHLILNCIGDADYKTMAKSFTEKNNCAEVRFFSPNMGEAMKILNDEANKYNVKFIHGSLAHLYDMHEKNLSLCISDIKKLSILDEDITVKTISNQCFGMGAVSLDEYMIKLFSGVFANADLYKLLEEGINEVYLVNQLTTFVQQLFNINSYIKLYGSLDIRVIWGYPLPKDIAQARANVAMKFNHQQFSLIFNHLLSLELELKSGKIIDANSYTQASLRHMSAILR